MPSFSNFRKKIRVLRKLKGLSQEKLAEYVHCNYKTISNLENDKYTPDLKQIINICDVLDVSLDALFSNAPVKKEGFLPAGEKADEYPVFVKRIPLHPRHTRQQIEDMEYTTQKLPHLTEAQLTVLRRLVDLF